MEETRIRTEPGQPMLKAKTEVSADLNPQETQEWLESLDEVIDAAGPDRAPAA